MTQTRQKIKLPTIATRAEAEEMVGDIALLTNDQIKVTATMDEEINEVRARYEKRLAKVASELKVMTTAVCAWAEANPDAFPKGKKSIEFTQGTIGFRTGTPKLALLNRSWNWDRCLEMVRRLIPAFIRDVPEIDKASLIAQRDEQIVRYAIQECGMKFVSDESFFIEPKLTEVETRQKQEA